jgi:hypothetical protein
LVVARRINTAQENIDGDVCGEFIDRGVIVAFVNVNVNLLYVPLGHRVSLTSSTGITKGDEALLENVFV